MAKLPNASSVHLLADRHAYTIYRINGSRRLPARVTARCALHPVPQRLPLVRYGTAAQRPQLHTLRNFSNIHVLHRGRRQRRGTLSVKAVFEKFTERSIKAVMIAQSEAKTLGTAEVTTEHILLGLIREDTSSKNGYLNSGLTVERIKAAVETLLGKRKPLASQEGMPFSQEVRRVFEAATNECKRSGVNFIAPEHILLALLSMPDALGKRMLDSLHIDCEVLKAEAVKRLKGDQEAELPKKKRASGEKEGPKALEEYCRDLCEDVRKGRIDPVIGREKEVARVTQILARRTKNNPILLGEPGVGKTAVAEGLACCIVNKMHVDGTPLPSFLETKRVMQLDVGLMIAGAKERGELENRVTRLIAEVKAAGNVVLMIDEVHTLVGAGAVGRGGGGGGGLDISNLLKPALARGEVQCIGATTLEEHRKYIERDAALERRFQPVYVNEPDETAALDILRGLKERYERHHRCAYSDEALQAAVSMSNRYIADRFLPDKAIDLIDEAGSRVRIAAYSARRQMEVRENPKVAEYLQVLDTKGEAVKDGLYEEASILRRREMDYRGELVGYASEGSSLPVVQVEDIETVLSAWTGIPVERMSQDEKEKLCKLGSTLKQRVVGQDDAVEVVASALMRARCGLKDPRRPVAALLFVGPTGVGKTELTKVLAETYFGSQDAIVRLDMSEYMERHTVSKLIGAPPGYVGYGDGGKLTEAVRRRPCSIVLFDEIEKAHPDVFSILLQIMEDGRLTDSSGRTVTFKNTMIVLTSNIGSRVIASSSGRGRSGAFSRVGDDDEPMTSAEGVATSQRHAQLASLVMDEVKSYFRPELLNRFDEQVVFHKLSVDDVHKIARIMLAETIARVAAKGIELEVTSRLMDKIVEDGYSDEYGVRPLRQVIVQYVDDVLSDELLHSRILPGGKAVLDVGPEGQPLVLTVRETISVAGHACGVNGEVLITTESLRGADSDSDGELPSLLVPVNVEVANQ